MRIISYHTNLTENANFPFWITDVAIDLCSCIAQEIDAEFVQIINYAATKNKFGEIALYKTDINADISFARMSDFFPYGRTDKFLVVFMGDYTYYKKKVHTWIQEYKPELILCTNEIPLELKEFCNHYGSRIEWMPFFLGYEWQEYGTHCHGWIDKARKYCAFISGCIGKKIYPARKTFYDRMKIIAASKNDLGPYMRFSCNETFGKYPMSFAEYKKTLCDSKYYVTGGIMDRIVPCKIFEAALLGTCVVCNPMPMLESWGFINKNTIITTENPEELEYIFRTNIWQYIGPAARDLVLKRHIVQQRAKEMANIIKDML